MLREHQRSSRPAAAAVLAVAVGLLSLAASAQSRAARAEEGEGEGIARLKEKALRGRRRTERLTAVEKLGAVRDVQVIQRWRLAEFMLDLARDRNPWVAWKAVRAVGGYVDGADPALADEVRPPLVGLAGDSGLHVLVCVEAVRVLGRTAAGGSFEARDAVGELVKLATPGPSVRPEITAEALAAAARTGDPRAAEPVQKGLYHRSAMIREAALEALAIALSGARAESFLSPRTGEQLLGLLSRADAGPQTKTKVLRAIGRAVDTGHRIPKAESEVLELVGKEEHPGTLVVALDTLASLGTARSAGPLREVYGRFGPPGGTPGSKGDGGPKAVRAAACASAGDLVERWGSARAQAGDEGAARELLDLLVAAVVAEEDASVLKEAVTALGAFHAKRYEPMKPRAVEALLAAASEQSTPEGVRKLAVDALKVLTGRLYDDPARWRSWAAEELGLDL